MTLGPSVSGIAGLTSSRGIYAKPRLSRSTFGRFLLTCWRRRLIAARNTVLNSCAKAAAVRRVALLRRRLARRLAKITLGGMHWHLDATVPRRHSKNSAIPAAMLRRQ